jgi:hypothetical protein
MVAGMTMTGRRRVDKVVPLTIQRVAGMTMVLLKFGKNQKGRWHDDIVF